MADASASMADASAATPECEGMMSYSGAYFLPRKQKLSVLCTCNPLGRNYINIITRKTFAKRYLITKKYEVGKMTPSIVEYEQNVVTKNVIMMSMNPRITAYSNSTVNCTVYELSND